jgi:vancomycin permeability regulator SanA
MSNPIVVLGFAIYAAVGCLIVRRQPRNIGPTVPIQPSTERVPARTLEGATS